jgi:hypothetical protein
LYRLIVCQSDLLSKDGGKKGCETYCQSFLMCVRCASLVLKATAHELQVYGWVWVSSEVPSMV